MLGTVIVVSSTDSADKLVVIPTTTSGTKLSDLRYWSKLLIKSLGPP